MARWFESLSLWERGERAVSLGYMASTVAAGFVAVTLGVALARELTVPRGERAGAEARFLDLLGGLGFGVDGSRILGAGQHLLPSGRGHRLRASSRSAVRTSSSTGVSSSAPSRAPRISSGA